MIFAMLNKLLLNSIEFYQLKKTVDTMKSLRLVFYSMPFAVEKASQIVLLHSLGKHTLHQLVSGPSVNRQRFTSRPARIQEMFIYLHNVRATRWMSLFLYRQHHVGLRTTLSFFLRPNHYFIRISLSFLRYTRPPSYTTAASITHKF